jgi:lipopolysaccharide/colanic/teichoic acid biosynthesis glycosyltransferase
MLLIAILVRLESHGPAFYCQTRRGRNGRPFRLYKFRSMRVDPGLKPRITHLGQFLRKTGIDALPLLWNVLRGDMSIIGPRAEGLLVRIDVDVPSSVPSARPGIISGRPKKGRQ